MREKKKEERVFSFPLCPSLLSPSLLQFLFTICPRLRPSPSPWSAHHCRVFSLLTGGRFRTLAAAALCLSYLHIRALLLAGQSQREEEGREEKTGGALPPPPLPAPPEGSTAVLVLLRSSGLFARPCRLFRLSALFCFCFSSVLSFSSSRSCCPEFLVLS